MDCGLRILLHDLRDKRLQSARRSFQKDDLFFREFLFAKGWEQGLHQRYGWLLQGEEWAPLRDRLQEVFPQLHTLIT